MKKSLFSGAAEAGDELRDCFAGPHAELGRAGDTPQPRPAGARLPARREDDAQQAQARHQVQAEEGDQRIDIDSGCSLYRGTIIRITNQDFAFLRQFELSVIQLVLVFDW